jgi:hypothetical protein
MEPVQTPKQREQEEEADHKQEQEDIKTHHHPGYLK